MLIPLSISFFSLLIALLACRYCRNHRSFQRLHNLPHSLVKQAS